MNDIFCIISAINVNYGIYSYKERLSQLIETIDSIAKHMMFTNIVIMEVSPTPIPEDDLAFLKTKVNSVMVLSEHIFIKELMDKLDSTDPNLTARKTIGELVGMLEFMGWLKQSDIKFNRIYKVAGRHRLNDNFKKIDYTEHAGKVVCAKRDWYGNPAYLMQLWSFDHSQLNDIFDIFVKIWDHEINILKENGVLDILETTLYKYLNEHNIPVYEVPEYVGIEGNHGQDGVEVYV